MDTWSFDYVLANFFSGEGLSIRPDPDSGVLKLDDLNNHHTVEHNASLSRANCNIGGDRYSFDFTIWYTALEL